MYILLWSATWKGITWELVRRHSPFYKINHKFSYKFNFNFDFQLLSTIGFIQIFATTALIGYSTNHLTTIHTLFIFIHVMVRNASYYTAEVTNIRKNPVARSITNHPQQEHRLQMPAHWLGRSDLVKRKKVTRGDDTN